MKKVYLLFFTFVIASSMLLTETSIAANDSKENKPPVQLSNEQVQELANLHAQIMEKRKEVIAKYVEYGVISEEKAKKIITRLEKHHKKLEENQFIPKWDSSKHKGHKRSED